MSHQEANQKKKPESGIYLMAPHAKMVWQGNKSLIVKSVNNQEAIGKDFYIIEGNDCYGIITVKDVKSLSLEDFTKLAENHRIKDFERQKWWANAKELFAYAFEPKKMFDRPMLVPFQGNEEPFVNSVEFLSEIFDKLPRKEEFVNKVFEMAKEEIKRGAKVCLFETIALTEPGREFDNEDELVQFLFGGV